jgi:hypothetical protein
MGWNRRMSVGLAVRLSVVGGAAALLIGCQSVREAAGVEKSPPDEFAVVTKAPLVIPPDYNLRPPSPGAPPTNQVSATATAQDVLSGTSAEVAQGLPSTYSPAEKNLLANTGAASADHTIRTQIAADSKAMAVADPSFTDQLLFNTGPKPDTGKPVDADAEHDRIVAQKSDGQTPVTGLPSTQKDAQEGATIDKNGDRSRSKADQDQDSGWFDGWFDGIF